jgi:hypothetical protein
MENNGLSIPQASTARATGNVAAKIFAKRRHAKA